MSRIQLYAGYSCIRLYPADDHWQIVCPLHRSVEKRLRIAWHDWCCQISHGCCLGSVPREACGMTERAGSLLEEAMTTKFMDFPACIVSYAASRVGKRVGATHDCVEAWQFIRQSCMIAVGCLRKATNIRGATNHRTNSVQMSGVLLISVQIGYEYHGVLLITVQ